MDEPKANPEKDVGMLGGLFQTVVNDLRVIILSYIVIYARVIIPMAISLLETILHCKGYYSPVQYLPHLIKLF